jgi:hypothetical protein
MQLPSASKLVFPLPGLAGGESIRSVALSPDGSKLAVAGVNTIGSPALLNVYSSDGTGSATTLVTAPDPGRVIHSLKYSPDGSWVAFIADLDTQGVESLYVVPAAGGAAKLVSPALSNKNLDVVSFAWARATTASEAFIAFTGDLATNSVFNAWVADAAAGVPAPVALVSSAELAANEDVQPLLDWDATKRVYFMSDFEGGGVLRLYRANANGSAREKVPGTTLPNNLGEATLASFGISSDGTKMAFSADSPNARLLQVYVVPVTTTGSASQVSAASSVAPPAGQLGPAPGVPIAWSKDGARLGVVADWVIASGDLDNAYSAFVLPTSGSPGGVRILGVPSSPGAVLDVDEVAFSPDSLRLFVRGDLVADGSKELYSSIDFSTADQSVTSARIEEVPSGGSVAGFTL